MNLYLRRSSFKHLKESSFLFFMSAVLTVSVIISVNFYVFPDKNASLALYNPRLYFNSIFIFIQLIMLHLSCRITVYSRYGLFLKIGIIIWIAGETVALADEFSKQPVWVTCYIENALRLSGILIVCISGYKKIKNLEGMYSIANLNAMHDELTSLPNRRLFIDSLHSAKNKSPGLILIDIDFFKKINDMYGHARGDKVLNEFGILLDSYTSEQCIPARIGGEEFAVLVKDAKTQQLNACAKAIIDDAAGIVIDNKNNLSVSIGLGIIKKGESTEQLIKRTDQALYKAKNSGRGKIEWSL